MKGGSPCRDLGHASPQHMAQQYIPARYPGSRRGGDIGLQQMGECPGTGWPRHSSKCHWVTAIPQRHLLYQLRRQCSLKETRAPPQGWTVALQGCTVALRGCSRPRLLVPWGATVGARCHGGKVPSSPEGTFSCWHRKGVKIPRCIHCGWAILERDGTDLVTGAGDCKSGQQGPA